MSLLDSQLPALKSFVLASPEIAAIGMGNTGLITAYLNSPSTTVVWRTAVSAQEVMSNGFVWSVVDSLSVGKARQWEWLTRYEYFNPSKANVRQCINEAFSGSSPMRESIFGHCKRFATIVESLYTSGTGTAADPAQLTYQGDIAEYDLIRALALQ